MLEIRMIVYIRNLFLISKSLEKHFSLSEPQASENSFGSFSEILESSTLIKRNPDGFLSRIR
jgi:hypothetical protein